MLTRVLGIMACCMLVGACGRGVSDRSDAGCLAGASMAGESDVATPLCNYATLSSALVEGSTRAWGCTESIRAAHDGFEPRDSPATRLELDVKRTAHGAIDLDAGMYVGGAVGPAGESVIGQLRQDSGSPRDGYFFVVRRTGVHVIPYAGYFWRDGALVRNAGRYRSGLLEAEFLSEVARLRDAGHCPADAG